MCIIYTTLPSYVDTIRRTSLAFPDGALKTLDLYGLVLPGHQLENLMMKDLVINITSSLLMIQIISTHDGSVVYKYC